MPANKSIDEKATLKLLKELVAIDSVNSSLVAGARGERRAARHVQKFLRAHGIAATLEEAARDRPNVVATIPAAAKSRGRSKTTKPALMIAAHIDTVGAGGTPEPFTPRVRDGKLYGRGALDIKSGVAAMCAAAASVAREHASGRLRLARPFAIAAVVDEECNSIGTEDLLRRGHTADFAVVLEPTDLRLVVAHKGYAWFEIVTHGRAAHGSLPAEGRDAIRMMGRVLVALDELEARIAGRAAHPRLGQASLHASLISGGQELSSYPAECRVQIERRLLPGETEVSAERELREMLAAIEKSAARDAEGAADFNATLRSSLESRASDSVKKARASGAEAPFTSRRLMSELKLRPPNDRASNFELSTLGTRPAYEISEDSPVVQRAAAAIRRSCGECEFVGMAAWTDTALLEGAGIPGVVFGPRGRGLHGEDEYVETESVHKCAAALREMILEFCL